MHRVLLHVLTREMEATRPTSGAWSPPGLAVDGFVHLCTADQLTGVLQRFHPHGDVVILALDEAALGGGVRDEDLYGHGAFPHLYGPIPSSAVLRVMALPAGDPLHTVPALLARR